MALTSLGSQPSKVCEIPTLLSEDELSLHDASFHVLLQKGACGHPLDVAQFHDGRGQHRDVPLDAHEPLRDGLVELVRVDAQLDALLCVHRLRYRRGDVHQETDGNH